MTPRISASRTIKPPIDLLRLLLAPDPDQAPAQAPAQVQDPDQDPVVDLMIPVVLITALMEEIGLA